MARDFRGGGAIPFHLEAPVATTPIIADELYHFSLSKNGDELYMFSVWLRVVFSVLTGYEFHSLF